MDCTHLFSHMSSQNLFTIEAILGENPRKVSHCLKTEVQTDWNDAEKSYFLSPTEKIFRTIEMTSTEWLRGSPAWRPIPPCCSLGYQPTEPPESPSKNIMEVQDHVSQNQPVKSRSPRIPFSRSQINTLEAKFQSTRYLGGLEVHQLAKELALTETRVKIWFQNRRARERRDALHTVTQNPGSTGLDSKSPTATDNPFSVNKKLPCARYRDYAAHLTPHQIALRSPLLMQDKHRCFPCVNMDRKFIGTLTENDRGTKANFSNFHESNPGTCLSLPLSSTHKQNSDQCIPLYLNERTGFCMKKS